MFVNIPAQYTDLITTLQNYFETDSYSYIKPYVTDEYCDGVLDFFNDYSFMYDEPEGYAYVLKDLDGNGIPELLLIQNNTDTIYDLYTIADERLVHMFHAWARNTLSLTSSDQLINYWSNGADDNGVNYYKVSGSELLPGEEESETVKLTGMPIVYEYYFKNFASRGRTLELTKDATWMDLGDYYEVMVDIKRADKGLAPTHVPVRFTKDITPTEVPYTITVMEWDDNGYVTKIN